MITRRPEITPKLRAQIARIVHAGGDVHAIAARLGVATRTIYRWASDDSRQPLDTEHQSNGRFPPCAWPGCTLLAVHWRIDTRRRAPERLRACEAHLDAELPALGLTRPGDLGRQLALLATEEPTLAEAAHAMRVGVADVRDLVARERGLALVAGRVVVVTR